MGVLRLVHDNIPGAKPKVAEATSRNAAGKWRSTLGKNMRIGVRPAGAALGRWARLVPALGAAVAGLAFAGSPAITKADPIEKATSTSAVRDGADAVAATGPGRPDALRVYAPDVHGRWPDLPRSR